MVSLKRALVREEMEKTRRAPTSADTLKVEVTEESADAHIIHPNKYNDDSKSEILMFHHVLPLLMRAEIMKGMTTDAALNGDRHICVRSVRHFPQYFHANSSANTTRAFRL